MNGSHHISGCPRIPIHAWLVAFAVIAILVAGQCIHNNRIQYAASQEVVLQNPQPWVFTNIRVERYADQFVRTYHTRTLLTLVNTATQVPRHDDDAVPARVWAFRNSMIHIPGVTDIVIYPYAFEITIGAAYRWEEIEPMMAASIRKQYMWLTEAER